MRTERRERQRINYRARMMAMGSERRQQHLARRRNATSQGVRISVDNGTTTATPVNDGETSLQHSSQPQVVRRLTQIRRMARPSNQGTQTKDLNFIL